MEHGQVCQRELHSESIPQAHDAGGAQVEDYVGSTASSCTIMCSRMKFNTTIFIKSLQQRL